MRGQGGYRAHGAGSPGIRRVGVVFRGLAAGGVPIGFAMLGAGIAYVFAAGRDVGLAGEQILNGLINSFVLLAVPLFIFAANVMNAGTISDRLLAFCLAIVLLYLIMAPTGPRAPLIHHNLELVNNLFL